MSARNRRARGVGQGGLALALLLALAAPNGCGKYGSPVRSAPDQGLAARGTAAGLEAETATEADEDRERDSERTVRGESE